MIPPDPSDEGLLVIAVAGEAKLALCAFNSATGKLVLLNKVPLPGVEEGCGGVPMVLNRSADRLYVAWRGEEPRLFSFQLQVSSRQLEFLGVASLPASMCYASLSACETRVLTSSYTGSTIAISPIDSDGTAQGPLTVEEASHAHCLVPAPNGLLYATSLRGDFVQSYALNEARNGFRPIARTAVPAGSGPRHIVFSSDGKAAYLLAEFSGTVSVFFVEPSTGGLVLRQTVSLLKNQEKAWASEIRLCPDEAFLFASERNTSQLFAFRLASDRKLQVAGSVSTPECPRAFSFDASGHYLIALGEKSGEAWTYRRKEGGVLECVDKTQIGRSPSWVVPAANIGGKRTGEGPQTP